MSTPNNVSVLSPVPPRAPVPGVQKRTPRRKLGVTSNTTIGRRPRWRTILAYTGLSLASFVAVFPFFWALLTSIKPYTDAFVSPPVWTFTPQITAYEQLWYATEFASFGVNTIVVAVVTVIISLAVGAPAAYALSRFDSRISLWLLVLALVFRSLPRFVVVLPFYSIAQALNIYDTQLMLIIALVAVNQPFTIWLLRNFFAELPRELDEAAQIDGCSRLGAFRRVIMPLAGPGLVTAGIFTFLLAIQEYLIPVVLTQQYATTLSVFIASFGIAEDTALYQLIAAASILLALPIIALAFFAQRFLVTGLTGGAIKG
ncbi:carbohydrate ABC transporter permease [Arthrobacter sp. CG_A4]|uniref:carbohydrate ABC transporter permease n=1 Tax=Arthrobacter sp. CG_A4 TaxID=3071706 RepID=UPI002E060EDE|nr:multiple sugar transport system permease protein [Arthrobacter sp. CG_A4]